MHDRMPVILDRADYARWLDPAADPTSLAQLLQPYDVGELECRPVNTHVNNVRNQGAGVRHGHGFLGSPPSVTVADGFAPKAVAGGGLYNDRLRMPKNLTCDECGDTVAPAVPELRCDACREVPYIAVCNNAYGGEEEIGSHLTRIIGGRRFPEADRHFQPAAICAH